MADQDVQINIKSKASGDGFEQTRAKIKELYTAAAAYEEGGGPNAKTKAGTARADAAKLQSELNRATRETEAAEKSVTREKERQLTVARAQEIAENRTGRGIARFAQAAAIAQLVESVVVDAMERKGIANRDVASRAVDTRKVGLLRTFGDAGQAFSESQATAGDIFEREQSRPELQRKKRQGVLEGALQGLGYGAGVGFVGGTIVPGIGNVVGTIAGAGIGAISGGVRSYFSGSRAEDENEVGIKRLNDRKTEIDKAKAELFARGPGREIERQKELTAGHFQAAVAIRFEQEAYQRYQQLKRQGATPAQAQEGADIQLDADARQRQIAFGRGAITARSGNADVARVASLARGAFDMRSVKEAVHSLERTIDGRQLNDSAIAEGKKGIQKPFAR